MRLTPKPLNIGDKEGFTEANDLFGYKDFGERLANLVCNVDEPLVIALDGPWGSGKSTFIKQWMGLMRQRNAPVIYIDAFANDFADDPFVVLAGEILSAVDFKNKKNKSLAKTFGDKAVAVGKSLLPAVAKIGLSAVTLGVVRSSEFGSLPPAICSACIRAS